MSKQETFEGVEVFEVGARQLQQFIEDGGLYRPVLNRSDLLCPGVYAVVFKSEMFGGECASWCPTVVSGYVQAELNCAIPPQVVELESCSFGRDVEIWRIVDDAELWQAWEHDSAIACKRGGQPTDYHVYDGRVCVLDLVREVPQQLYCMRLTDLEENIISSSYYVDPKIWADCVSEMMDSCDYWVTCIACDTASQLGLYVVDDWDHDEGLADGITVLNVYLRV